LLCRSTVVSMEGVAGDSWGGQLAHAGAHIGFDEIQHLVEILDLLVQVVLLEGVADGFAGDGKEGIQDARAAVGHGFKVGDAAEVQAPVHDPHGHGIGEIPLVVLKDEGDLLDVQAVRIEVVIQIRQRIHIVLHLGFAGIRHEDHTIGPAQHHPAAGVVLHLARHGIDLEMDGIAIDVTEVDREQIEEEGPILLGIDGEHLAALLVRAHGVQGLQIGGLSR